MEKRITEYRINKKGAECFRTRCSEEAHDRLRKLSSKRPGVYTIQIRDVPVDRHGVALTDGSGKILWSDWH